MIDPPKNVEQWLRRLLHPLYADLYADVALRDIVQATPEAWANAAVEPEAFVALIQQDRGIAWKILASAVNAGWFLHRQLAEQQARPSGYNDAIVRLVDKLKEAVAMPPGEELTENQRSKLIGVGLAEPGCKVRIDWMDPGLSDIGYLMYTPFNYGTDPVRAGVIHIPEPRLEKAGAPQGAAVWVTVHSLAKSEQVMWIHFDPPSNCYN
jgi:hypothetical protein